MRVVHIELHGMEEVLHFAWLGKVPVDKILVPTANHNLCTQPQQLRNGKP